MNGISLGIRFFQHQKMQNQNSQEITNYLYPFRLQNYYCIEPIYYHFHDVPWQ